MGALGKLRELSGAERRLLVASAAAIPLVRAGLAIAGFARTKSMLARWSRPKSAARPTGETAAAKALAVARIAAVAARSGPVRSNCLPRSLWLWALLRRDGIEAVLRVGVNRDDGTFHAHAWVEHCGRPLIDTADVGTRFPAFEQDFGRKAAQGS